MTVSSQTSNETFNGNGVTTVWDLPFRFFDNTDIDVYLVDPISQISTPLVLGSDYTLSGAGLPEQFGTAPGKITTLSPVASGKQLYVERVMDVEQLTDIVNQGRFFPEVHEDVFDRLTMLIQQTLSWLGRALVRPVGKNYYDAEGRKIKNLGDGVEDPDAVNIRTMRSYVDSAIAGVVGGFGNFLQAGIGAVYRTFQDKMRDAYNGRDFGAVNDGNYYPVSDWYTVGAVNYRGYADFAEVQAKYPLVTSPTDSIDWAAHQAGANAAAIARRKYSIGSGTAVLNKTLVIPEYLVFEGEGPGQWLAWTPAFLKKNAPTQFVMYGTGPKVHTLPLVTDNRTSGGVVTNPTPRDSFDGAYKLSSFMNDDGTARPFSVAIKTARSGRGIVMRHFRVVPNYNGAGGGVGIDGYNDTVSTALGDDWDWGLWNESGQNLICENVHAVGHWRMGGSLQTSVIDNNPANSGSGLTGAEYSRYSKCNFQGAVGVSIRGGDVYRVTEKGANYVGIENAPNLPFLQASSGKVKIGGSETSAVDYTYTAVTVVGGNLRLTITESVAPVSVGNVLVANIYGFGISNTVYEDCEVSGFCHPTQRRATQVGLTKPSAALEISGSFLRGVSFRNSKFIGVEDVLWHLHNGADITFESQAVVESKVDSITGTVGGRCIASPTPSLNTRVPNPMGQTDGVLIDFGTSATNTANDLRPFSGIGAPSRFNGGGDLGLFTPQSTKWNRLQYPADRVNTVIRAPGAGSLLLRDSAGVSRIQVTDTDVSIRDSSNVSRVNSTADGSVTTLSGGTTSVRVSSGFLRSTANGVDGNGSSGARWATTYSNEYYVGTGNVRMLSGAGSPEGAVTALVGTSWQRSDGGAGTTYYIKETGTGNTGWAAK